MKIHQIKNLSQCSTFITINISAVSFFFQVALFELELLFKARNQKCSSGKLREHLQGWTSHLSVSLKLSLQDQMG